jgi:hypothetical protein
MADGPAAITAILAEFSPEDLPVLLGYLRVRLGWGAHAHVVRANGTGGVLDQTFELARYDKDLQRRVRHAADRLEPLLQD